VVHYLERLKAFFFAESHAQLSYIAAVANQIERQVSTFESNERTRWTAFEQLYLCWLSDPDRTARLQAEIEALHGDLGGRVAAFDERNRAVLDRLASMDVQNRNLLETLIALDRNHRALSTRLDQLETETRRRWEALDQLLTAFLSDPDRSIFASIEHFGSQQGHHESAAGGTSRA
jgi:hypothetical protein